MNTVLQIYLIGGLIIGGFLLAGFILWVRTKRFIERSQKAEGVVIKVKSITFENRDTFSPVVRFTTSDGRALSFTDPVSKYPAEFEVGDRAQVLYDLRDPHKARVVKRLSDLFLSAKLFGTAGAALLLIGLLVEMLIGLANQLTGSY
jgi:hypothetical protein